MKHSRTGAAATQTASDTPAPTPKDEGELTEEGKKIKSQNCEAAKKNLAVYKVYKRIKGPDGKVTALSDEDRQKRIEEAQNQIDLFCK